MHDREWYKSLPEDSKALATNIQKALGHMWLKQHILEVLQEILTRSTAPSHIPYNKAPKLLPGESEGLWQYAKSLERRYQDAELSKSRKTNRRTPFTAGLRRG